MATTTSTAVPAPGQIVRVRSRQYIVEDVVLPPAPGDATLVRLACVDDDAQGQPLEVLWELELDTELIGGESWEKVAERGFDDPNLFAAYLNTLRWNCVTATDPRLFQSPFRAGIKIEAYQLEPLRKALLLPRVNLFIADDVGLGKTIEAGLIMRELLLRKKVRDIVVSCPPSMLPQWQTELENRFGLMFETLDKSYVARVRQERGYGINPWTTHTRFLISQRLLIDEAYTATMRDWLGDLRPGSLLVLDEAHHAAPSSGARYAIDSKITHAVRELAPRFEHRLFLSATPHNGHSNSFSALLEILDPQRFCRGVTVRGKKHLDAVMVRRLKDDVREIAGGFPKRVVKQIDLDGLPAEQPELRLAALLDEYRRLRERRLEDETSKKRAAAGLLVTGLQQRLLSSIEAFARTLRVHRRTVEKHRSEQPKPVDVEPEELDLLTGGVGNDDDRADLSEDELEAEDDAQIEAATLATGVRLEAKEDELLTQMTEIAEASRGLPDARVLALIDWIKSNMCAEPGAARAKWNDTRAIIFTEYDDTKRYLYQQLSEATAGSDRAEERIAIYHGPTPVDKREEIKRAFNAPPSKHPVRILIATDAAREGLNLQCHCWNLFHFDVPWNPARMEQRNGRIDRKLQPRPEVFCHYFVYKQRPEDRILQVLVRKTEIIKQELGSLSQVLEGRLAAMLRGGIRRADLERQAREMERLDIEADRKKSMNDEFDEVRERQDALLKQVDRLRSLLAESEKWIGLETEQFKATISCALKMLKAEPLQAGEREGKQERFVFPSLDQRDGADPTWADTMDALRAPKARNQKLWEWRRESPVRPVVFEDPGTMDESIVHLHLEHRVVQRLLGRFRAQGFVHNDLSRACLATSSDPVPRVVLLGRLCLYGPGAARLHEELIPVTARWVEPNLRKGPLPPYKREAEGRTLELLREALIGRQGAGVPKEVKQRLQSSAPRDIQELLPHLGDRGRGMAEEAEQRLADRAEREAKAMLEILQDQKKRVAETAREYEDPQLLLDFKAEELDQLKSNKRYWQKRLAAIDRELETEPERIGGVYAVKATRIEPVGIVYLWPVTG